LGRNVSTVCVRSAGGESLTKTQEWQFREQPVLPLLFAYLKMSRQLWANNPTKYYAADLQVRFE
jgi:hypothetical protein